MFEQYVKLFHLGWIEPWMVEALVIMFGALILGLVVCKATECITGQDR